MIFDLPTSVTIGGNDHQIRSDYRAVLDICTALTDPDLSDQEKAIVMLDIFYPNLSDMPPEHYEEAVKKCFWFINCGEDEPAQHSAPKLVDWEQDFKYIVAPVNRVVGTEIRALEYLHWWSFISAYYEIGDCTFAQIVRIRDMLARGKQLDKVEREWYEKNRNLVDLKVTYTEAENELLKMWGGA